MKIVLLLILCSCLSSAELLSDLDSGMNINRCMELMTSKEQATKRTAFGVIALTKHGTISKEMLSLAMKQAQSEQEFDKTATLLALSPDRDVWCEQLYQVKAGQALAAAVQAAGAMMYMLSHEDVAGIPLGAVTERQKRPYKPAYTDNIHTALVSKMLQSKSTLVREYALIAAAYQPNAAFEQAVSEMDGKSGITPGAQLLYFARSKKALDPAFIEQVVGRLSKQPKPIRSPNGDMMNHVLRLPAMVFACEALGIHGDPAHLVHLNEALSHKDLRVQMEALKAIGRIANTKSVAVLLEHLGDKRFGLWPLQIQLLDALGKIPDTRSIPVLIEHLGESEGRIRLHIIYALNAIKGEKSSYQSAKQWSQWWSENAATFAVDAARSKQFREAYLPIDMHVPSNGDFYGLPIYSDRLCFVVDTSFSMKGDRIANLREQLSMSVESLHKSVHFNLVDFGGKIHIYYEGDLCQDKKGLLEYVTGMPLSGGTRSFDSMEIGMQIDPVDTIYFLSDGRPIASQINKWPGIHAALSLQNRFRPIAIFSVSFSAGKQMAVEMQRMSRCNDGRSHEIE